MLLLQVAQPIIADPSVLTGVYEKLVPKWTANVFPYAAEFFTALALLNFAAFGWKLWRRHGADDIRGAIASTTNEILVMGVFLSILLNGPQWMQAIINMFIDVGKAGSGVGSIQPSVVLTQGVTICGALMVSAAKNAIFGGPLSPLSLSILLAALVILGAYVFIVIEFIVTKIQTFLVLGMGLFFLSFGGSSWTRNYVERYFAYAVASGVRLMSLYFLIGAGGALGQAWVQQAAAAPWSLAGVQAAMVIACGAVIYAAICLRCSAIASQILGGGPNLSHGDVFSGLGQIVGAGVTAGLLASGIGSAAIGAGKAASGAAIGIGGVAGSAPTSGPTPQPSPGGGAGGSNGSGGTPVSRPKSSAGGSGSATAIMNAASGAASTLKGMGGNGHQVHVPQFNGFHGE